VTVLGWGPVRVVLFIAAAFAGTMTIAATPLRLAVMDPLAKQLSCPCVQGHAQRDYEALAAFLGESLGREVTVRFGESLDAFAGEGFDVVIGKRSVVEADAARLGLDVVPIAALAGRDGLTTQRGLVVVRGDDPARTVADLEQHRILLGPADCDEKHAAARAAFAAHGIDLPPDCPTAASCSDGAAAVVEAAAKGGPPTATVISSYAQPLLEGCGTVKKGDLRVVGETGEVSFITVFASGDVDPGDRVPILAALLETKTLPLLQMAIESQGGFQPLGDESDAKAAPTPPAADWPGWRGRSRDARVAWLPTTLPDRPVTIWKRPLFNEGLGGVAMADGIVLVGDRDTEDRHDVFHAVDFATGKRLWTLEYAAEGRLDYGNSPRATPLVHEGHAFLLGAFGHLHCVRLADGAIVWSRHLRHDFGVMSELVWGVCSSPLIADKKLLVNPGGPDASVVALDPATGDVVWRSPGGPAAFSSFVECTLGGRRQVVGFDATSLGGWDIATGARLWTMAPKVPGDFNVPTPLVLDDSLAVSTENNGTRLVGAGGGRGATYAGLAPDMHTPVVTGDRILGISKGKVHCLGAVDLEPIWTAFDRSLTGHVSLVSTPDRVLAFTEKGEIVLLDARADSLTILARLQVLPPGQSTYAHPAVVGGRIIVRGPRRLECIALTAAESRPPDE
jgi:ABC-type phosphate/phosphonate transport system substrate-binding protein